MIDGMSDSENLAVHTLLNSLHTFLGTAKSFAAETAQEAFSGRSWSIPAEPVECAHERDLQPSSLQLFNVCQEPSLDAEDGTDIVLESI